MTDEWVSDLKINDKAVSRIALGLAGECHNLALARGVTGGAVKDHLPLVFSVLDGRIGDLLLVSPVSTGCASELAAIRIGFCPLGYRRIAEAAKDRVADAID